MLAFVTSLRHPQNSNDYSQVEALLQSTLASISAQTDDDYIVIVVGNRAPSFALPERVEYVQVAFDAPAPPGNPTSRDDVRRDKGRKLAVGLIAARRHEPDYAMIFDADDYLHRDLVKFTVDNPGKDGWVVSSGWIYSKRRNSYRRLNRFNTWCGSCYIVDYDIFGVPSDIGTDATEEELRSGFGERLDGIIATHRGDAWYREHGYDLEPLPWPGVVYHVDTGENRSRKSLTGMALSMTPQFAAEFAIPPSHGRLLTWLHARGPVPRWQTFRGRHPGIVPWSRARKQS
ncbi:glycosyltransferase family A protein [Microbacterium sp. NPDC056044]|uniref:glycosyltransferase family A protein n=1 Tax=Microbacterium sp. NPDC056044 TaxID=3345690 RepID=UPI0035DEF4FB